jgi:hypothetical protein
MVFFKIDEQIGERKNPRHRKRNATLRFARAGASPVGRCHPGCKVFDVAQPFAGDPHADNTEAECELFKEVKAAKYAVGGAIVVPGTRGQGCEQEAAQRPEALPGGACSPMPVE